MAEAIRPNIFKFFFGLLLVFSLLVAFVVWLAGGSDEPNPEATAAPSAAAQAPTADPALGEIESEVSKVSPDDFDSNGLSDQSVGLQD